VKPSDDPNVLSQPSVSSYTVPITVSAGLSYSTECSMLMTSCALRDLVTTPRGYCEPLQATTSHGDRVSPLLGASPQESAEDSGVPVGAYGLTLSGVDGARAFLVPAPPSWPVLDIVRQQGGGEPRGEMIDDARAELALGGGGHVRLARHPLQAVFETPVRVTDAELVHPFLSGAAAVSAFWLGRESFHAGAFVADGGAWALIGDRQAGKSSMLAWLALHGHGILSDDVLVVDGVAVFAGPRSVDLRAEPAVRLGTGEPLGRVGVRDRWRLQLAPVEAELPLYGWILLGWGEQVEVRRLPGGVRVTELARHRIMNVPPRRPEALLDLATLPAWELRRPQRWDSIGAAADQLLQTIAG
jgi:hypothetical protein